MCLETHYSLNGIHQIPQVKPFYDSGDFQSASGKFVNKYLYRYVFEAAIFRYVIKNGLLSFLFVVRLHDYDDISSRQCEFEN